MSRRLEMVWNMDFNMILMIIMGLAFAFGAYRCFTTPGLEGFGIICAIFAVGTLCVVCGSVYGTQNIGEG